MMQLNDDGQVTDQHVEKMFSDLYNGTYKEDEITLSNFKHYLEALYDLKPSLYFLPSFDRASNVETLLNISLHVGGRIHISTTDDGRYAARFPHWEDENLYVMHERLPIVIALCIIQTMRHDTLNHLNSAGRKH